jgi:hypothetical protein
MINLQIKNNKKMKNDFQKYLLIALLIPLLAGCFASGPKFSSITLRDDQAVVFVYRPSRNQMGSTVGLNIKVDGKSIGTLLDNGYLQEIITPGKHEVSTATEITETVTFVAEKSKAYYIKAGFEQGVFIDRPVLKLMSDESDKTILREMHSSK